MDEEMDDTASTSATTRRESVHIIERTEIPSGRLNAPPTYGSGKCLKCLNLISLIRDSFRCGVCRGRIHITCVPGSFSGSEITKLQSTNSPFSYVCYKCAPTWNTAGTNSLNPNEVLRKLNEQHQMEINELNEVVLKLQTDRKNFEQETQDFKRQVETLTSRFGRYEAEHTKKRARNTIDDSFC